MSYQGNLITTQFLSANAEYNLLLIFRESTQAYELQLIPSVDRSRMNISHEIFSETINPDYMVWVLEANRLLKDYPLHLPQGLDTKFQLRLEAAFLKGNKMRAELRAKKAETALAA